MDLSVPPPAAQRDDNLFTTVPGDFGSHGRFDDRATDWSLQYWLSIHRRTLMSLVLLLIILGLVLAFFID